MVAAINGVRSRALGVKDGENPATGMHGRVEVLNKGLHQRLRDIVEGRPEKDNVESASGEIEGLLEEAGSIESGFAAFLGWRRRPVSGQGFVDHVGHVAAVTETGKEVDIAG